MVCAKCEKVGLVSASAVGLIPAFADSLVSALQKYAKSSSLACSDVWRPTGAAGDRNSVRKVGENKLLSSKNRYTPYSPAAGSSKGGSGSGGIGGKAGTSVTFDKCIVCKVTCSRVGAKYCQGNAG